MVVKFEVHSVIRTTLDGESIFWRSILKIQICRAEWGCFPLIIDIKWLISNWAPKTQRLQALQTQKWITQESLLLPRPETSWSNDNQYCSTSDQHCFPATNQSNQMNKRCLSGTLEESNQNSKQTSLLSGPKPWIEAGRVSLYCQRHKAETDPNQIRLSDQRVDSIRRIGDQQRKESVLTAWQVRQKRRCTSS